MCVIYLASLYHYYNNKTSLIFTKVSDVSDVNTLTRIMTNHMCCSHLKEYHELFEYAEAILESIETKAY